MLAVQRPSMGSSKSLDLDMPFGYLLDPDSTFPFPSPTSPAPGPCLLDDNESRILDHFFEGVSTDQFEYDFFNNPPDGSELGCAWDEIPPAFVGSTSSVGQQPPLESHALPDRYYATISSHMNARPSITPATSADVLASASMLQNRSAARSHSMSDELFRGQDLHGMHGQIRTQSMSKHPPRTQTGFSQRLDHHMRDNFFTDMVFGSRTEGSMRQSGSSRTVDIHWGSDVAFCKPHGFVAPPSQENHVASGGAYKYVMEIALNFNLSSSADTSWPSSPVITKTEPRPRARSNANQIEEDDQDSKPKKGRKSKIQDEEEPTMFVASKSTKKRELGKKASIESPAAESESTKRKSIAVAAAKAREILTEDQKRESHIKSEQKRRTLIREGFADLGELVPGLRGGGFSKSAVLIMAADWLEDLIEGNGELQRKLDQMQGR